MSRLRVVEPPTELLTRQLESALHELHRMQITQPSHDRLAFEAHIQGLSGATKRLSALVSKASARFAAGEGGQPNDLLTHCRTALSRTAGVKLAMEREFSQAIQATRTHPRHLAAADLRHHFITEAQEVLEPEVFEALMAGARKRMADAGATPSAQPQEASCPTSR
jgi:hypothetical protein